MVQVGLQLELKELLIACGLLQWPHHLVKSWKQNRTVTWLIIICSAQETKRG